MRVKSLVTFRSKSIGFEEAKMEKLAILDPSTIWETSTVTEEQILSLVDRRLLRLKSQVGWRPVAGEAFPTEGTGEMVVFIVHIERGFGVPAGDFLTGLLQFYSIELVHLAPNSITIIATFIHLCEAYLGIALHFHLWRHFFELKKMGKGMVIGSVSFMLRRNMKSEYIDLALPDNTTGWKEGWFYLDNPASVLRSRMRRILVVSPEWTNQLATLDTQALPGRPGAAQDGGANRRCGGHQLLPPSHPASPGPGPSGLRVLGAVRPNRGRTTQGLQGGDDSPREEHLRRVYPQQGVPQGARDIQPCRPSESLTLVFLRSKVL
jgi:hypothetical protein